LRDEKKAEEITAQRVHLLAPLLAKGLDAGQARVIKTRICEQITRCLTPTYQLIEINNESCTI